LTNNRFDIEGEVKRAQEKLERERKQRGIGESGLKSTPDVLRSIVEKSRRKRGHK
jgi:hypothetical protein